LFRNLGKEKIPGRGPKVSGLTEDNREKMIAKPGTQRRVKGLS
jgi:hypothetical protein